MGYCKLECPDNETECCICCTKQDSCQCRCDDIDSYEYAEECPDYASIEYDMEDFKSWLAKRYSGKHSAKGDLCRDIKSDKNISGRLSKEKVKGYLKRCGACNECIEVFEEVWKEYETD